MPSAKNSSKRSLSPASSKAAISSESDGGRGEHPGADQSGETLQAQAQGDEALRLAGADALELAQRGAEVVVEDEMTAALEQVHVGDVALVEVEPVAREVELADDLGVQQADHVGAGGRAEARDQLLGDRRAAHHAAPLDDRDAQPGIGEIVGGDEPVMARSDDDDILARHPRESTYLTFK